MSISYVIFTQLIEQKCVSVEFLEQKFRLIKDSDLRLQPDRCIISMQCAVSMATTGQAKWDVAGPDIINTFFSISAHISHRTDTGEKLLKETLFYMAIWAIASALYLLSTVFLFFNDMLIFPCSFQTSGGGGRTSWWQKQETDGCMRRP